MGAADPFAGEMIETTEGPSYRFPDAVGAYWPRLIADKDTTATAMFIYE